jgi:hypothetical protein
MNSKFYPSGYPSDRLPSADDSTISSLDTAIELVNVQAIDTALQQSHTRRIGGANSIQNQNSVLEAINRFMPNSHVGPIQVVRPSFNGTTAFLAGGRGYGGAVNLSLGFSFDSETSYPIDLRLSELRFYMGTLNSPSSGVFAGGYGLASGVSKFIDIIKFALPSISRSGAMLSNALFTACGVGDSTNGFLLGGSFNSGVTTRSIDKFNHQSGTCIPSGSQLSTGRSSPHNGLSSRTEGVILGGSGSIFGTFNSAMTSIEIIDFATEAMAIAGANLTYPHITHAAFGDKSVGYVCGGMASATNVVSNLITKYIHSTRTTAPLSVRLQEPKICCDGVGSGRAGYVMGGDTASSQWLGTTGIDKIQYGAIEVVSRLGSQLGFKVADQGAVSDFNA